MPKLLKPAEHVPDRELVAEQYEGAAADAARVGFPKQAAEFADLARGFREGVLEPGGPIWRPGATRPPAGWLAQHDKARAWLTECARERGEEPAPCWCPVCFEGGSR